MKLELEVHQHDLSSCLKSTSNLELKKKEMGESCDTFYVRPSGSPEVPTITTAERD